MRYIENWRAWFRGWRAMRAGENLPYGYQWELRLWVMYVLDVGANNLLGRGVWTLSAAFGNPLHTHPERLWQAPQFGSVDLWK